MFQLKGRGLDACAPSSFLAGSAKSASALEQDATRGSWVASRSKPRLSPVFEWIRVRVAPYAQYVRGGDFAHPVGRPGCRCPDLLTALAARAGEVRSSAGRACRLRFRGEGRRKKARVVDGRGMLQRRPPRAAVGGGRLACAPPRVQGRRGPACRRGPWGLRPRPGLPRKRRS